MANSLRGRKILVTGATGFIGRNLIDRLLLEKSNTHVLVRNSKDAANFKKMGVGAFVADLTDSKSLRKFPRGIDIVFNLAGGLPYHKLSDEEYFKINVDGVRNLMEVCIKRKVKKVVHISTVGIYGEVVKDVDEKNRPVPVGVYAKSKLAGEKIVMEYSKKLKVVIVRPTIAYGPYDTRPVVLSIFKFLKKGFFVLIGGGENYFHTVFVSNLVDGLILAATKKSADGKDFIIADEPCLRFKDLVLTIQNAMLNNSYVLNVPIEIAKLTLGFVFPRKLDFMTATKKYRIDKAKKLLGYKPKIGLDEGVRQTLKWYKKESII